MSKFSILGIEGERTTNAETLFNTLIDEGDDCFLVTKKRYKHREEGLNFNYHYGIQTSVLDNKVYYSLCLILDAKSITKKHLQSIADFCGCETNEINAYDIFSYGLDIQLACHTEIGEEINYDIIDQIANTVEVIDSLRGFYLDRPFNKIGTTGWDVIKDALFDKDWVQATFAKY